MSEEASTAPPDVARTIELLGSRLVSVKFFSIGSFFVRSRNLFVLVGDVIEGELSAGSFVSIPLTPGLAVTAKIQGVEVIEIGYKGAQHLGLVIEYEEDPAELEVLSALVVGGETLELVPDSLLAGEGG